MPELKRPLDTSDSTALVVAKKPRNELVQVTEKEKALVASVSLIECPKNLNQFYSQNHEKYFNFKTILSNFRGVLQGLPTWKLQSCY